MTHLLKRGFLFVWGVVTYLPPIWVMVLNSVLIFTVSPAYGHSKAIVQCKKNILYKQATKAKPDEVVSSVGLLAEYYDTNKDGQYDVIALSHTSEDGKTHRENPLFWIVDTNYDGQPDAVYIDPVGKGLCNDITLYQDLHMLHEDSEVMDHGRKL